VGSSNGTFVNGQRLSPENVPSGPRQLHSGDTVCVTIEGFYGIIISFIDDDD
jgi:hypothetical protein